MRHGGSRGGAQSVWLAAALGLAAAQGIAGLAVPAAGLVTTAGLTAQCLLAATFALVAARDRRMRLQWLALAVALLCWAGGYVAIAVEEVVVGPVPTTGLVDGVLFVLKAAPFLLLLTAGLDARASRGLLRIDLVGALVFVGLAMELMLGDPFGSGRPVAASEPVRYRDIENLLLAGLAVAAASMPLRAADRAFYRAVAWLLVSYAAVSVVTNHVIIPRVPHAPGTAWLTVATQPFIAFHLANRRLPVRRFGVARAMLPVRLLAPVLLTAASLLMAFVVARRGDAVGMAGGMAALVLYAWRTSVAQRQSRAANAQLRRTGRRLELLAMTDPLTGVANRRAFDAALLAIGARAERDHAAMAVLILDIDWFKRLNDTLGHTAGDACLRRLAVALADTAARSGTFARLGGEEFGVVGGLDPAAAIALGESLREAVETLAIPHPASPLHHVTISVGVATGVPTPGGLGPATLLAEADAALYAAKANGRNAVGTTRSNGAARVARPAPVGIGDRRQPHL